MPDARDFTSNLSARSSYETIALHYKVAPWSDEHFRLMEPGIRMLGQLGNDVLQVPVITQNQFGWALPLIRFRKQGETLKPDFTVLQKYLDLYAKHCAPPKALCLYVWDERCATRGANVYEGRQIPSREFKPGMKLMVQVVGADGTVSEAPAPQFGAPGAEQFYKPLVDGVREIVVKRGWSERVVMLSMGGDNRPSQEDGVLIKQWFPYVRWNILSHFSGDPCSFFNKDKESKELLKAGKLIAVGGHEVGVKEHPWNSFCRPFTAAQLEQELLNNAEYLDLGCARWHWQDYSPPHMFATLPMMWGNFGRVGLDFWVGRDGPRNASYFTASTSMTVPGPDGALPTVRFQMFREGMQNMELRLMIARACQKLPEARKKPYHDLLDEFPRRVNWASAYLSQHELSYDWLAYVAEVQEAMAALAGVKSDARWSQPPGKERR